MYRDIVSYEIQGEHEKYRDIVAYEIQDEHKKVTTCDLC